MARERSAAELQQRLEDVLSQSQEAAAKPEPVSEQEMVETMFGFLPNRVAVGGREGPAPEGFEVRLTTNGRSPQYINIGFLLND